MRTTYSTSEMDLVRIKAELVECENRPDKHAFFLQLRDGKRHRSVRQLELEWGHRKVTRQEPASLTTEAGQSSKGLQGATAVGSQADEAAVAAQSYLPKLPQLPLVPQSSPGQPQSQAQSLSEIDLQSQTRSAGQTKSQTLMQSQPQKQPETQRQTSPLSQLQPQQSLHQLKNNVRQDERKQQQSRAAAHEAPLLQHQNVLSTLPLQAASSNGNQAPPKASDPSLAQRMSDTETKLPSKGGSNSSEASPVPSKGPHPRGLHNNLDGTSYQVRTADKTANQPLADHEQKANHEGGFLDEALVQQIEVHHSALKSIFRRQMREKRASLGLHQLKEKLTFLQSQAKVKESQVERYSKILDLVRQSTHLEDTDQQYLAETLERVETARQALTSMQQQQHVLQTLLDQGNIQFQGFQSNLVNKLLDFDILSAQDT